jgi:hypothetical protein
MALINHPNGKCPITAGRIPACQFIPHNDGVTVNPIGAWNDWMAAIRPSTSDPTGSKDGAVGYLCQGLWLFNKTPGINYGYFYRLKGAGSAHSRLLVRPTDGGAGLSIEGMAATSIQDIGIIVEGNAQYGVYLYGRYPPEDGNPADRNRLLGVQIITRFGTVAQGALVLDQCSDTLIGGQSRILNYSPTPSPTLRIQDTGGHEISGMTELHNFSPDGAVLSLKDAGRLTMLSGLLGSNAPLTGPSGRCHVAIYGASTEGLSFAGTKFYSESGQPSTFAFWMAPGSYLDWVEIGASVKADSRSTSFGGSVNVGPHRAVPAWWTGI